MQQLGAEARAAEALPVVRGEGRRRRGFLGGEGGGGRRGLLGKIKGETEAAKEVGEGALLCGGAIVYMCVCGGGGGGLSGAACAPRMYPYIPYQKRTDVLHPRAVVSLEDGRDRGQHQLPHPADVRERQGGQRRRGRARAGPAGGCRGGWGWRRRVDGDASID